MPARARTDSAVETFEAANVAVELVVFVDAEVDEDAKT